MCLTKIQTLGSSLEKLLSTLKKNREAVPLDILKTYYQQPYGVLISQVNQTATAFVKAVLAEQLILNPDVSIDEQVSVINQTIADSGVARQMGSCISHTYSVDQLYQMSLELRGRIEYALWPYLDLKTCLVYDLDNPDQAPVIYNTLTKQVYKDGIWMNQELNLEWKFLFYPNTNLSNHSIEESKNGDEYQYGTENNSTSIGSADRSNLPQATAPLLGNGLC